MLMSKNNGKNKQKQSKKKEEVVVLEKINERNVNDTINDGLYYLIGVVIAMVLIFATREFLSSINYLFVIVLAVIAVIQMVNFVMDREYEKRNYSGMVIGIMSIWMAMFVFKYGDFLFLEMLPVLVSLLLFIVATNSFTKYFDRRLTGNLVISIISLVLGVLLIFVPKSVMYILFKITGVYILIMILVDFIDYRNSRK